MEKDLVDSYVILFDVLLMNQLFCRYEYIIAKIGLDSILD